MIVAEKDTEAGSNRNSDCTLIILQLSVSQSGLAGCEY